MWQLSAILLLFPLLTRAQPVTLVTKQHKGFREEYYVLKADNRTRQGTYLQISDAGKLRREGSYNRGTQVGKWKTYYRNGLLFAQGSYSDGYETGVWEYYAPKGHLVQKYDYALQKLVYYYRDRDEDTRKYKVVTDKGIVSATLSRPPLYTGGIYVLQALVKQNLANAYEIRNGDCFGTDRQQRNGKRASGGIFYQCIINGTDFKYDENTPLFLAARAET